MGIKSKVDEVWECEVFHLQYNSVAFVDETNPSRSLWRNQLTEVLKGVDCAMCCQMTEIVTISETLLVRVKANTSKSAEPAGLLSIS